MSIYQHNMGLLRQRFPDVADKIAGSQRKKVISLKETSSGVPSAQIKLNDKLFWMHSSVDPLREAERAVKPLHDSGTLIYCVLGIGLGYTVYEILKKKNPKAIVVICEPDAGVFKDLLYRVDLRNLLQNTSVLLYCGSPLEIAAGLRSILLTSLVVLITDVDYIVAGYIRQAYAEWARDTRYHLQNAFRNALFAVGNDIDDTLVGMKQIFDNIAVCLSNPGINGLKDSYAKTPAIIVSAGPSLQKNMHLLKEAKGKALIFAVDTTLRPLLKMGLVPDAVFVVERFPNVYECHFRDLDVPDEVVMIALPVIFPPIYETAKGPKLIAFRGNESLNDWINTACGDKGVLEVGGSVAHMAFSFARFIGADPIIFIGQDLAYAEDGSTHSAATVFAGNKLSFNTSETLPPEERTYLVPGYYGKPVPTCFYLRDFLIWFENHIQTANARCINATEGGALIKGAENMPLQEVLNRFCRYYLKDQFLTKVRKLPLEDLDTAKKHLVESVNAIYEAFRTASLHASEAMDNCSPIVKDIPGFPWEEDVDGQLNNISGRNTLFLNCTLRNMVVVHFIQPILTSTMHRLNSLEPMDTMAKKLRAIQLQHSYFAQVKEVTELVAKELKMICDKIQTLVL